MKLRWEYGDTVRLQQDVPRFGLYAGDVGETIESADADAFEIWVDFEGAQGSWCVRTDLLFNETSYAERRTAKNFWDKLKSLFHRT